MNLSLTDGLRDSVNSRTGNRGVYATPSKYLRDFIRRDMENQAELVHIAGGLDDLAHEKTI